MRASYILELLCKHKEKLSQKNTYGKLTGQYIFSGKDQLTE